MHGLLQTSWLASFWAALGNLQGSSISEFGADILPHPALSGIFTLHSSPASRQSLHTRANGQ